MHLKEIDALRKEKETNKLPAQAAEAEQLNNEIGAVLKEKGAEAGTTPTQEEINEAVKRLDESRNANK